MMAAITGSMGSKMICPVVKAPRRMNARHWWITRDGDPKCLEMYKRHYSRYQYKDGREPNLFVGPGEKLVLRTRDGDAFFVWRKFIDDSGEKGVNCAAFRNESDIKSSELIRQACEIARVVWPDSRMYTFVNPGKVRSKNPGYCFLMAGWWRCQHRTKSGLIVFDTW